ncbi:MAG: phage holin family protein [Clostridia bacterium]|nr:phage holin family protein [Clostridia bacterium]
MKGKFRNYGLWISMISAILMILQAMGLKFDLPYVNEIITSILGVLVAMGIISNPSDGNGYTDSSNVVEDVTDGDINSAEENN